MRTAILSSLLLLTLPTLSPSSPWPRKTFADPPKQNLSGIWRSTSSYQFRHIHPDAKHVEICNPTWPASGTWNGWRLTVVWRDYVGQYDMINGELVGGWIRAAEAGFDAEGKIVGELRRDVMVRTWERED